MLDFHVGGMYGGAPLGEGILSLAARVATGLAASSLQGGEDGVGGEEGEGAGAGAGGGAIDVWGWDWG